MIAKTIAPPLALAAFIVFFGIIVWKVPRLDLTVVIAIGLLAAVYDMFDTWRRERALRR